MLINPRKIRAGKRDVANATVSANFGHELEPWQPLKREMPPPPPTIQLPGKLSNIAILKYLC